MFFCPIGEISRYTQNTRLPKGALNAQISHRAIGWIEFSCWVALGCLPGLLPPCIIKDSQHMQRVSYEE